MSLLISERPLIVLPALASRIGLNEAIMIQQLHWLIAETNFGKEKNGHRWIYNTPEGWRKWFPFFSESTIRRTLDALRSMRLISAEQLEGNMKPMFYRVSDAACVLLKEGRLPELSDAEKDESLGKNAEPLAQNEHAGTLKMSTPYIDKEISKEPPNPQRGNGSAKAGTPVSENAKRLAAIFHRAPTTQWTANEVRAFKRLTISEEDLNSLELYYSSSWPPCRDKNILRHDLSTLLNNFAGEVDRAKMWATKQSTGFKKSESAAKREDRFEDPMEALVRKTLEEAK